jgi:CBS-domain-containing membrane protein
MGSFGADPQLGTARITDADLDEVMTDYGEAIDISREDLHSLFDELLGRHRSQTAYHAVPSGERLH